MVVLHDLCPQPCLVAPLASTSWRHAFSKLIGTRGLIVARRPLTASMVSLDSGAGEPTRVTSPKKTFLAVNKQANRQAESSLNPLSVPNGVTKLCRPEFRLVGARMRVLSHGFGVSTFPWGCVTDTREKESPLAILRSEGRGPTSYPGLGLRGTPSC
ncbi:hypothetical protein CRG98_022803 [Punica granatum]|uniref:Uncharacterized protein n=1 Tax=Punica granatum TaxID=22663 RepID=A0A2I0JKM5_PUNGR|nr:hypothetical protein CRG98_022803 [Punica granatum]